MKKFHIRYSSILVAFLIFNISLDKLQGQWPGAGGKMPAIGVIQGTVLDSISDQPIEYASVSLINIRSGELVTGGLTDKTGRFNIREVPLGQYQVMVEFIGYARKEISPINIFPGERGSIEQDLENIQLQISSVNLAQVEVLGESQFIQTIDKQIFTVGKNLASSGGSGEDVLNQVPTVAVDIDGNITLRGDANVTVLIDGKKVGFDRRSMVDNLQASMIEKVEVITNPSAKYDPDGVGGIINLILKRGAFEGFNGTTALSTGQYNKNNISGNLNFRTDTWNIFSNASYRTGERYSDGLREFDFLYFDPSDSVRYLYQNTERTRTPKNISFRFGGDLYPTPTSTISYTSTFSKRNQNNQEIIETTRPVLSILDIKEMGQENDWDHSLSYENKFDSKDRKLNANISYGKGTENETEENIGEKEVKDHHDHNSIIASFDYEDKLWENFVLEAGFKTTLKTLDDDLFFQEGTYDYNYDEDIYALYTTLGYEINDRLGLKGGLRLEQVETKAIVSGDTTAATSVVHFIINEAVKGGEIPEPYSQLYPSLFLNYKLTEKQQIQFGFSKRVNRPWTRSLNPFPREMLDTTHIRTGNPYVKPEFSDVMEINFSSNSRKFNFNTGVSYKHTIDAIAWWDRDEIEYDGRYYEVLTSGNADSEKDLAGSIIINYRPLPLIGLMFTTWWWRSETDGGQYEEDMTGTSYGMHNRGQLTLNIPTVARLELSVSGMTMKLAHGTIGPSYGADLGIEKSFMNNRLSVTLKVNDLFDNRRFIIDTTQDYTDYTQVMYAERKRGRRTASINLRYNFGKQQKKKWDRKNFGGHGGGGGMDMDY